MLLSLPDTWNYSVRGLSSITPDGVDGVLTALKELERLGYLERNQQRESIPVGAFAGYAVRSWLRHLFGGSGELDGCVPADPD